MEGVCILVHPPDTRLGLRGSVRMGGQQKVVDGIVGGVGGGFVEVALCAKLLCLFVDLPELDCFVCGVRNFENYHKRKFTTKTFASNLNCFFYDSTHYTRIFSNNK